MESFFIEPDENEIPEIDVCERYHKYFNPVQNMFVACLYVFNVTLDRLDVCLVHLVGHVGVTVQRNQVRRFFVQPCFVHVVARINVAELDCFAFTVALATAVVCVDRRRLEIHNVVDGQVYVNFNVGKPQTDDHLLLLIQFGLLRQHLCEYVVVRQNAAFNDIDNILVYLDGIFQHF